MPELSPVIAPASGPGSGPEVCHPSAVEALGDLDRALALVDADPAARALAAGAGDDVVPESPLAAWLYAAWWAGIPELVEGPSLPELVEGQPRAAASEPLAPVLEAARRSATPLESGWLVLASDGVRLVCARLPEPGRGGPPTLVQRAADAVVDSSRPGCAPRPGDLVTLFGGSGGTDPDDAWWWAHTGEPAASQPLDRWYVHALPDGSPAIVAATVTLAAETGVALSLKCPTKASGFARTDALVVYVPRSARAMLAAALPGWLAALEGHVGVRTPPLTRRLASGVATAEDPGGGLSYGQLRCAQVAAAIARLRREPDAAPSRRLDVLAAVGLDPRRPEEVS